MPGWLSVLTLCHFLLPWAFSIFYKALGDSGKALAPPRIWVTAEERLQVWGKLEGLLLDMSRQ